MKTHNIDLKQRNDEPWFGKCGTENKEWSDKLFKAWQWDTKASEWSSSSTVKRESTFSPKYTLKHQNYDFWESPVYKKNKLPINYTGRKVALQSHVAFIIQWCMCTVHLLQWVVHSNICGSFTLSCETVLPRCDTAAVCRPPETTKLHVNMISPQPRPY